MRSLWCAAAVTLASCAELATVETNVCGNGVVEPANNEFCDSGDVNDPRCGAPDDTAACQFVCTESACPDGYGCSVAGVCTAAAGSYEPAADTTLPLGQGLVIQDVDGDGYDDLVTRDASGLLITFGAATRALTDTRRVVFPLDAGRPGFVDANGDGRLDIVIGLEGGVILLQQDDARSFVSAQQVAVDASAFAGEACAEIQVESVVSTGGVRETLIVAGATPFLGVDCGDCAGDSTLVGGAVPQERLGLPGSATNEVNLPVAAVGDDAFTLYGVTYVEFDGDPDSQSAIEPSQLEVRRTFALADLALPVGEFSASGQFGFGDFDADGCQDILVASSASSAAVVLGRGDVGCGAFADVVPLVLNTLQADGSPLGRVLGAGTNNRGDLAFVIWTTTADDALFASAIKSSYGPSASHEEFAVPLGRAGAPPRAAVVVDYNADERADIAVITETNVMELFLATGEQSFNRFVVDLPSIPRSIASADVDGDLVSDLVLIGEGNDGPTGNDEVLVVYGDLDARLDDIRAYGTAAGPLTAHMLRDGGLDSIFISGNPTTDTGGCARPVSVLFGDTSRQLVSPMLLQCEVPAGPLATKTVDVSTQAVLDTSTEPNPELLMIIGAPALGSETGRQGARLVSTSIAVTGGALRVRNQTVGNLLDGSVRYNIVDSAVGRVSNDAINDVVVVQAPSCTTEPCPRLLTLVDGDTAATQALGPLAGVPTLLDAELRDLDGDGDGDLLGAAAATAGDERVAALWITLNEAGALDVEAAMATPVALPAALACRPLRWGATLAGDGALPFLAACDVDRGNGTFATAVVRGRFDPVARTLRDVVALEIADAVDVRDGDLDGDGLRDLVVITAPRDAASEVQVWWACATPPTGDGDVSVAIGDGCQMPVAISL